MGDGADSGVFSLTGGECDAFLAATAPADRDTAEGHDVSGDAAACVRVGSKIAVTVNPPCQNVAVVGARVSIGQALVVSVSHVYKSTFYRCHADRARGMQE